MLVGRLNRRTTPPVLNAKAFDDILVWAVIGVLIGLYVLEQLDIRVLIKTFGVVVIVYGCFALATASRPVRIPPPRPRSTARRR